MWKNSSHAETQRRRGLSRRLRALLNARLRRLRYAQMRLAAEQLRENYAEGGELTEMTSLDSEDFI